MLDIVTHRWLRIPYKLHANIVQDPPRPRATLLLLHGIGNNGHAWDAVARQLPDDVRIVTIDLLGFGRSPRPHHIEYSAHQQARSILRAYFALGVPGRVIIVGHSLGSLIAVEIAKRYPLLVKSLVLVSPPFYRPEDPDTQQLLPRPDAMLRTIYRTVEKQPNEFVQLAGVAMRYKLVNEVFSVTDENIASYMATLQTAIVNQTSIDDVEQLTLPIEIVHGRLDPFVVTKNLRYLARTMPNVSLHHTMSSHELTGSLVPATVRAIKRSITSGEHSNPARQTRRK